MTGWISENNKPTVWAGWVFWGDGACFFVRWKCHLSHSVGRLGGFGGWSVFFRQMEVPSESQCVPDQIFEFLFPSREKRFQTVKIGLKG